MNERIRELLAKTNIPLFPLFPEQDPAWVATDHDMEKFAELIVTECAQFVEDKFDFCGDELIIAEEIKQHFGVEE